MVRLLPSLVCRIATMLNWFQSHNGAIAAAAGFPSSLWCATVSIPQWCDCCPTAKKRKRPASTVSIPQWCDCCLCPVYQHLRKSSVSIPQWCDCCWVSYDGHSDISVRFNPTMVRLLLYGAKIHLHQNLKFQSHNGAIAADNATQDRLIEISVSIPQWCDCCSGKRCGQ